MGFLRPQTLQDNNLLRFDRLIETGTSDGSGIERVQGLFKQILSVELDASFAVAASKRLKPYKHVRNFCGPSPDFLKQAIDPAISSLFMLDAHYMHYRRMPKDAGFLPAGAKQCPLMEELAAIFSVEWRAPFAALLDDLHLFQGFYRARRMLNKGYRIEEWPTEEQIRTVAADHGCGAKVIDDMLLLERQ